MRVDGDAFSHRMMANRLDPVAIGIAQEGGVVGRVIIAQRRSAVVGASRRNSRVPERIHLGPPLRLEALVAA